MSLTEGTGHWTVDRDAQTIVVAAPAAENASELLSWARRGLAVLGQGCMSLDGRGSFCTTRQKTNKADTADACQVLVSDLTTAPHLLAALAGMGHQVVAVCDEVASVEIPVFKAILSAPCEAVILAGTTSSCEGTGSALEWKVLLDTGAAGFKQTRLILKEPIRYGLADPLEELLDSMLFLGASVDKPLHDLGKLSELSPRRTKLLQLEPALSTAPNEFSKALVAVLQTHYRTSASDISMMTQEYARTLVLVPDASIEGLHPPLPLVVLLCILEAPELLPGEMKAGSSRLSSGLRGIRVARVVCDPRLRSRGFGSEAVQQLMSHLAKASLHALEPLDPDLKLSGLGPLQLPLCSWLGASFGLTAPLLRFWSRLGLHPMALSPAPNPQTGEVSVVMLKSLATGRLEAKMELSWRGIKRDKG
eukprot:symbB.v1.2.034212.t1/scaffold4379.1/size40462/4